MHNANPETIADCIVQSRSGGRVERCHGLPHLGTYSNATHQWGVALLMHYIWPEDFSRLALVCLTHDVPEAWVGDIPAPTCRYTPGLKESLSAAEGQINKDLLLPAEDELDPLDYAKLKCCDRLEFWLWCCEQELYGNLFAKEGKKEIERYFAEVPLLPEATSVYEELRAHDLLPRQAGVMKAAFGR
jgi:5'-deoxynucleotidase YfbR-like HD superfamily hydrolase